jgi:glycosyltransferase involved in cell wall biosynthesis
MKLAYAAHANSVLLYNELKKIHNRPFYVPNGVDTKMFYEKYPILTGKNMIFGHVGKKSPQKGQEEFIEPAIKKSGVKYFSHYNNHKTKISHNKMIDIHHNYDVKIIASKEDGTPCPGLEAAACGRPIITNKIGNMPELVETYKTGILLDKKDIDLYVDAIK